MLKRILAKILRLFCKNPLTFEKLKHCFLCVRNNGAQNFIKEHIKYYLSKFKSVQITTELAVVAIIKTKHLICVNGWSFTNLWELKSFLSTITVVDADEFMTPITYDTIPEFIDALVKKVGKNVDAIGINWLMHGFNGHYEKPKGLVCENFSKCDYSADGNRHIKSVINPRAVILA